MWREIGKVLLTLCCYAVRTRQSSVIPSPTHMLSLSVCRGPNSKYCYTIGEGVFGWCCFNWLKKLCSFFFFFFAHISRFLWNNYKIHSLYATINNYVTLLKWINLIFKWVLIHCMNSTAFKCVNFIVGMPCTNPIILVLFCYYYLQFLLFKKSRSLRRLWHLCWKVLVQVVAASELAAVKRPGLLSCSAPRASGED